MRGKKQTFTYGNDFLSITELLRKPETRIPQKGWTTNLRIAARETSKAFTRREHQPTGGHMEHAAQNPTASRVQDTRYGTQRRRENLPKKTTKGEVLFGPEPPPKLKRPTGVINIDGENLTARQTLERYPQLREFLQRGKPLKEKSLQAKARVCFKNGKRSTPREKPRRRTF